MMKFLGTIIFFVSTTFLYAQPEINPSKIVGDTIEGESTDTSIVYIVKKAPVTIKQRVEIERSGIKLKKSFYFTFGISAFGNSNKYKANSASEEYIKRLNTSTRPTTGYGTLVQCYNAPKTIIVGLAVDARRINEKFRYAPQNGYSEMLFDNSYTYMSGSFILGKWLRKEKKLSYQLMICPTLNYKFGVSGYSIGAAEGSFVFIAESLLYKQYYINFSIMTKVLYKIKHSFIEIAPFAVIAPFSMTEKGNPFSIKRNMFGVYLNLTNELF